jgi:hypothetical protein
MVLFLLPLLCMVMGVSSEFERFKSTSSASPATSWSVTAAAFMTSGLPVIRSEWAAGAHVNATSRSPLFHQELTAADPEFCEGFEILRVTAGN